MKSFIKKNKGFVFFIILYTILLIFSIDNDPKNFANHAYHLEKAKIIAEGHGISEWSLNGFVEDTTMTKFFFGALVAPFLKFFNYSFFIPRLFISFISIANLFLLYSFFKGYLTKKKRLLLIILTAINYHYFAYSAYIETEIPYIFFTLTTLHAFKSYMNSKDWKMLIILGILTTFTYLTRFIGVALMIAILLHMGLFFKNKKIDFKKIFSKIYNPIIYGISSISFIIFWTIRNISKGKGGVANNYINPWMIFTTDWTTKKDYTIGLFPLFIKLAINVAGYMYLLPNILFYGFITLKLNNFAHDFFESSNKFSLLFSQDKLFLIYLLIYILISIKLTVIIILGFIKVSLNKITVIETYIFFNMAILMLYPDRVPRFLISIIPFILYYLIRGIDIFSKKIGKNNTNIFYAFLILYSLISIFGLVYSYKANIEYDPNMKDFLDMAQWANKNLPPNTVILTNGKIGLSFFTDLIELPIRPVDESKQIIDYIKKNNAKYVIVDNLKDMDWVYSWKYRTQKYIKPVIEKYPEKFDEINEIGNCIIYKFND